jgi:hypothetical protein
MSPHKTKGNNPMSTPTKTGKALRIVGILLMGLTTAFNLMGGIGTSCVALFAEKFESMAGLVDYKWLYQIFVLLTIAAAVYGIYALVALIKGKPGDYKATLIALGAAAVLAVIHIAASRALRGKSQPNDMRLYITLFTLAVFLLFRIPGIWSQIGFGRAGGNTTGTAAGLAMFVAGAVLLTVQVWAGPTHTFGGINFADVWHVQLAIAGWTLVTGGLGTLLWIVLWSKRSIQTPIATVSETV